MGKKTKFQLYKGSSWVRVSIDKESLRIEPNHIVEVDSNDESYSYFVGSGRWRTVSDVQYDDIQIDKKVEDFKEDLEDDGKRNYSNDPTKGRKKNKKEDN